MSHRRGHENPTQEFSGKHKRSRKFEMRRLVGHKKISHGNPIHLSEGLFHLTFRCLRPTVRSPTPTWGLNISRSIPIWAPLRTLRMKAATWFITVGSLRSGLVQGGNHRISPSAIFVYSSLAIATSHAINFPSPRRLWCWHGWLAAAHEIRHEPIVFERA